MRPPLDDLLSLGLLLAITGVGSAVVGFVSQRLGWWRRLRSINQTLTLGYLLAAGLTLFNIWLTARLMFINQHDQTLASLMLLFASGISVSFGYFISSSMTQTLRDLSRGAKKLSEGDFSVRVSASGQDEVAQLAYTFNDMVSCLDKVTQAERALEESRSNLVTWASHDLRTPLASLSAMIDAMADGVVSDPETVTRYLRQSQSEIARISSLINDLFELSQIDTGHQELYREPSSLADLISDTLEGFTARARAGDIHLTGSVSADVDPIWMAPDKISRVLHNLLENAIYHTPPGGNINLQASMQNGAVSVSVDDMGTGISEEDLPHIFDRFYRGEKSRSREGFGSGGAGLGLSIAKGLVEAHGGQIWAESIPGEGTTIQFTLPKSIEPTIHLP